MFLLNSSNFQAELEVARLKVDTLQLKKNIAESKVTYDVLWLLELMCHVLLVV